MKARSLTVRIVSLVALSGLAAWLLWAPVKEARQERRVRAFLLELQQGLQAYHVAEELYPKNPMPGRELVALLSSTGHLEGEVLNPWTGVAYTATDAEDWLRYRTDGAAETYELSVYFPETEEVQFRLDSTENQSLEE